MNFLAHLRAPSPTVAAIVNDPAHPTHLPDDPVATAESLARRSLLQHHEATRRDAAMLLLHTTGSVKIGEILRYTITYYPARDRVLPLPTSLHLRIKNTEAIPLRAAYLHGPFVLYCSVKSATFDHWSPVINPREEGGYPEFEPNLKAGATWECELPVPATMRREVMTRERERRAKPALHHRVGQRNDSYGREEEKVTWVVEVVSQMIFSSTARIAFDLAIAREEKALGQYGTGFEQGTFSNAIEFSVMNTQQIWNTPPFPGEIKPQTPTSPRRHAAAIMSRGLGSPRKHGAERREARGPKKVHLVLITHGIHSNCGADMLFIKESIDKTAKELRNARRKKRREERASADLDGVGGDLGVAPHQRHTADDDDADSDSDEEEIITRGYTGNVCRTERGIKYLGKRLARYALTLAYPDRPLPASLRSHKSGGLWRSHTHNDAPEPYSGTGYKVTSISFIGHSLGGLVQTYAIAYIHAHDPNFFKEIQPVNFVALATPFLGLSNENPIYVKFALDFGFVGRTGQDLGLTWRAPNVAGSAMSGFSLMPSSASVRSEESQNPGSKPLLRILPMGPAKEVLRMFRNRTVYANVVNDGIVPLRTSCLLFLDWKGLGRVEKARRANEGPIGQVSGLVGWGLGQLTSGSSTPRRTWHRRPSLDESTLMETAPDANTDAVGEAPPTKAPVRRYSNNHVEAVKPEQPTPSAFSSLWTLFKPHAGSRHERKMQKIMSRSQVLGSVSGSSSDAVVSVPGTPSTSSFQPVITEQLVDSPGLMSPTPSSATLLNSSMSPDTPKSSSGSGSETTVMLPEDLRGAATTAEDNPDADTYEKLMAPPRTTLLEAAGDILNPPLPPLSFLINPETRPRTIFHDRVYHPSDIPPLPLKRAHTHTGRMSRAASQHAHDGADDMHPTPQPTAASTVSTATATTSTSTTATTTTGATSTTGTTLTAGTTTTNGGLSPTFPRSPTGSIRSVNGRNMKPEEKIARAFHDGISWRKVLVRLEPDAHNNIIVRREFSNAYGWPVVKHVVETHFGDTLAARMRDDEEGGVERALDVDATTATGHHWRGGEREVEDALAVAPPESEGSSNGGTSPCRKDKTQRPMSPVWSDRGDCSSDSGEEDSDDPEHRKRRQEDEEEKRRMDVIDSFLGKMGKGKGKGKGKTRRPSHDEADVATSAITATGMAAVTGGGFGAATRVGLVGDVPEKAVRARESLERVRSGQGSHK
ncbi:hypothetical protein TWF696_008649 [Orbilia brochopaga]|uniref:DUF676 domain-containing protein n=1 Tax=Orbilia brochopaga TaxID=3140254 RepID=A0AAV9UGP6_9PEZI